MKSIIEYYPDREKHKCGYCKQKDSSVSRGMWAHRLSVKDYQALIDRGWRRSGHYCYKPTMDETCCPSYTIKCDALNFSLTKSQKKLLKKVSKFILSDNNTEDFSGNNQYENTSDQISSSSSRENTESNTDFMMLVNARKHKIINVEAVTVSNQPENMVESNQKIERDLKEVPAKSVGDDGSRIPCKKAKTLRIERKKQKLLSKGIEWNPPERKNTEKSLEDYLNFLTASEKLKIKLVRSSPPSSEWVSSLNKTHELFVKYQTTIHNEPVEKCSQNQYRNFLVNSPLEAEFPNSDIPMGYGSFHQQYWLGEELIAVGVLDVLPDCVSSVYFYYDPKYSFLSLGTFGALQEIALTRSLNKMSNNIKHYYLGFYIHSCPKMRYKGNYAPSFLLCPETFKWFPIEQCRPKIDLAAYSRLNPDVDGTEDDHFEKNDIGDVNVLIKSSYTRFSQYRGLVKNKATLENVESNLLDYGRLVGKKCSRSILYVLQ